MKISVVVPVHNETDIELLITEIIDALKPAYEFEMIFIDDGSTDTTFAALQTAMLEHPQLRVLHHQLSCGQSRAIHSSISVTKYPWIAALDGDGQNDPADIPKLVIAPQQSEH